MTDRDQSNLEGFLKDPTHHELNVSMEKIIEVDDKGRITFFMPNANTKWGLIFYLQNLMIRQRLYQMDKFLDKVDNE